MPDVDVDFCQNRRGEVIEYVTGKYGREQVAQIITFNTMAAKASIKDCGRALDMPYGDVDRIASWFRRRWDYAGSGARRCAGAARGLREGCADPGADRHGEELEGLVRGRSPCLGGGDCAASLTELVR